MESISLQFSSTKYLFIKRQSVKRQVKRHKLHVCCLSNQLVNIIHNDIADVR